MEKCICIKCGQEREDCVISSGGEYPFSPLCPDCDPIAKAMPEIMKYLNQRKHNVCIKYLPKGYDIPQAWIDDCDNCVERIKQKRLEELQNAENK